MRFLLLIVAATLSGCLSPSPDAGLAIFENSAILCGEPCGFLIPGPPGAAGEPTVSVDDSDPSHVVVGSTIIEEIGPGIYRSWLAAHVSRDGGSTWSYARLPGGPSSPGHPLASYDAMADPVVEILSDDTVLFVGLAYKSAWAFAGPAYSLPFLDLSVFVARSVDGGLTYPQVQIVDAAAGGGWIVAGAGEVGHFDFIPGLSHDKPWLAEGPDGVLLLTWTTSSYPPPGAPGETDREDIRFSVSTDGGQSWTGPAEIAVGHYLGSSATIGPDGTFYVPFLHFSDPAGLRLGVSTDAGATWKLHDVDAAGALRLVSVAATGPPIARVLVAYEQATSDGRQVPHVVWSEDQGANWSTPMVVDKPTSSGPALPAVVVGGDGQVYVSYYLSTGPAGRMEFRAGRLDGNRFVGPTLLMSGNQSTAGWPGDYTGLAPARDGVFAAWIGDEAGQPSVRGAWLS